MRLFGVILNLFFSCEVFYYKKIERVENIKLYIHGIVYLVLEHQKKYDFDYFHCNTEFLQLNDKYASRIFRHMRM